MRKKIDEVVERVRSLVEPITQETNFELVDIEYLSEQGKWILRVYLDREGGITLDDCARLSGEIGDLIDVKDVIEHNYVLEVSSPGLSRPLKKEKDFLSAIGKKIKLKTTVAVEGRRNFTGHLRGLRDGKLDMQTEDGQISLSLQDVEKANLVYEFDK
jgi:ribosome maturation factor RimP